MSKPKDISKKEYWEWVKTQAATNRKQPTAAEWRVIKWFRNNNLKFHFQKPIKTKGGCRCYIVDFVIFRNLVIEVDGETHNGREAHKYDCDRTRRICREGFKVVRITNEDTYEDKIDDVLLGIIKSRDIKCYNRIIKQRK
jgi:very-short-patch-repair endonuclease